MSRPPTRMGRTKEKLSKIKNLAGEYAEDSNVAGLKQIFQASTHIARLIWALLFIICLVGFVYQVYDRVLYFITWPVSVNIEVTINETVIFPAITFCNTNSFRITKAEKTGLFNNLTAFYEHSVTNGSAPVLQYPSMLKMMEKLAHSKWDMIYSCRWLDSKCSAENFTEMITDYGLCYSFNLVKDQRARLNVSGTGSKYGLELVLNIEQYEYMAGPHDSAGVRVLVHDQNEIPRVKDLASSVPSSMNAFLGIQVTKVHNLPPPFGPCAKKKLEHEEFYSKSLCQDICIGKKVADICGCRAPHMNWRVDNGTNDVPVCSVRKYYACVKPLIDQSARWKNCTNIQTCPIKCLQTAYTADVSYTATSDAELHKKVKILKKNTSLIQKFVKAQVTRHRIVPEYYLDDQALISTLYDRSKQVMQLFGQSSVESLILRAGHKLNKTLTRQLLPKTYTDLGTLSKDLVDLRNNYSDRLNTEALNHYLNAMSFNVKSRSIVRYTNLTAIGLFHQIKIHGPAKRRRDSSKRKSRSLRNKKGNKKKNKKGRNRKRKRNKYRNDWFRKKKNRRKKNKQKRYWRRPQGANATMEIGSGWNENRKNRVQKRKRNLDRLRKVNGTMGMGSGSPVRSSKADFEIGSGWIEDERNGVGKNKRQKRHAGGNDPDTDPELGSGYPMGQFIPQKSGAHGSDTDTGPELGRGRVKNKPYPMRQLIPQKSGAQKQKKLASSKRNTNAAMELGSSSSILNNRGWGTDDRGGGSDEMGLDDLDLQSLSSLASRYKSFSGQFHFGGREERLFQQKLPRKKVWMKLVSLSRTFLDYKLPLMMVEEILRDAISLYNITKNTNLAILKNSQFAGLPLEQMQKKADDVLKELGTFLITVSSFQDNITEFGELIRNATMRFWTGNKDIVMPKLSRVQKILDSVSELLPMVRGRGVSRILKSVCDDLDLGITQVKDNKDVLDNYKAIISRVFVKLVRNLEKGRLHFRKIDDIARSYYKSLSNWNNFSKENLFFLLHSNQTVAFKVCRKYGTAMLDKLKSIRNELVEFEKNALSKINTLKQSKLSMAYASNSKGLLKKIEKRMKLLSAAIRVADKQVALYQERFGGFNEAFLSLRKTAKEFKDSLEINGRFVRRNFMKVNVFYQRLSYQEITKQEAYQWFSLVCDIGGSAGLLLGASLLTVAELVYFMINQCQAAKPKTDQVDTVTPVSYHQEPEMKPKKDKWDDIMTAW